MFSQIRSRYETRRFRLRSKTYRKSAALARTLSGLIAFVFLTLSLAHANGLVSFEVTGRKSHAFTLKSICRGLGHKHNLLIERDDQLHVNCMGKRAKVMKFCQKKDFGSPLLRAYIPESRKDITPQAYCITGKLARLNISCESKKTRPYCRDPKASCQKLRKSYARDLEVVHHNRKMNGAKETLNCHYGPNRTNDETKLISPNAKDSLKTES